ncbi:MULTISPECIES: protein TolR [unclassified Oleiphilus]|jgi:biopolymer transport protein TolR|nr:MULTISPECIES: protein TolR [unclassified Oleiphilus]KZY41758.1 protein TolR [Oleiphilus sp. HI0050]KZY78081.1 protein TolR [Oleiphilus sp. HI0068]KZY80957.1 protein TolR [Oleiphilus sp. HI0069]KZY88663.1 protein TolR [Oleiphilus sp. HI0072]KZZ13348.1 protein TolR [Oleiphilus sp. HI0078]KZZ29400.1 protein TolR [Oleiphilus sp. HI0081]KZZ45274.1 protein TolR [Oleiphilus sp. HI0085]
MSDINVVPYIDVMLVLLIIFMVTAPMLTQGIKIDLPLLDSDPVESAKSLEPIVVTVDSNGAYYMEMTSSSKKPLELQVVLKNVSSILQHEPSTSVLVRGDRHVEYGVVVELMAALQNAGAKDVGLITEDP